MTNDAPDLGAVMDAFNGYQKTAALKAAVELDLFTAIGAGAVTVEALASRAGAAPRGVRSLCDRLVVDGFLAKDGDRYALRASAAAFLDRASPAFVGSAISFLTSPTIRTAFEHLTDAVRRGGTALPNDDGTMAPDHPVWVEFARAMAPFARMEANLLAGMLAGQGRPAGRVLDVAAGHGLFGITLAQQDPGVQVTALDWAAVLDVAAEFARDAGVAARWRGLPGSAFTTDPGGPYDTILLTNFLHHFDAPTCTDLLWRLRGALAPGGAVVTVEFVPDEGRVTPPVAAAFSLVMLATTAAGDAWTFAEYDAMFRAAGYSSTTLHDLPPGPNRALVSRV